ncbi:hypothetical protein [Vibrio anguillarum]|uniref:hypothetical protein n=1 Tax=Vibrio anguillarum TaxID=55601 RepID=UPI001F1A50D0|nr:hypothetical protein [Vibrio anguillarum]EJA3092035.1 hypothetical protein [Vibrio parahaemolyticus]UJQ40067.1 hypothetical protein L2O48_11015 [Vibrio anguillarum]
MAGFIDEKVETANHRTQMIKEILSDLARSHASFKSARKLSEYVADKMTEKGERIDSSTLRRKSSTYKVLIDNYVGKNLSSNGEADNVARDLKLRRQTKKIEELEALIKDKDRELDEKESEIETVLIELRQEKNKSLSAIAPPKASIYSKTELTKAQLTIEEQTNQLEQLSRQLDLACKTLNQIMLDSHESYVVDNGQFKDTVASNEVMFNKRNLERYFELYGGK